MSYFAQKQLELEEAEEYIPGPFEFDEVMTAIEQGNISLFEN